MKRQYWIIGDWDAIKKQNPSSPASEIPDEEKQIKSFDSSDYEYLQKIFPSGKSVVIEYNKQTGQKLLLRPIEEQLSKGFFKYDSDILLDYLITIKEQRGFWPTKEIDLPVETEAI